MKVTRREGTRPSFRFSVSVNRKQADKLESALTFLEKHKDESASQVVVDLVIAAAKRAGWKETTPTSPVAD